MSRLFLVIIVTFLIIGLFTSCERKNTAEEDLTLFEAITEANANEPIDSISWIESKSTEKTFSRETEMIIVEFLSDYLSIFADVPYEISFDHKNNGRDSYVICFDPITGETINEAPYIWGNALAFRYFLYELDDSDMPLIFIEYGIPEGEIAKTKVYKYVNGGYTEIGEIGRLYSFYYDINGNLVMRYDDDMGGKWGCYYVTISDEKIELEVIVDDNFYNHITSTQLDFTRFAESYNNLTIPGMPNNLLIPIKSLGLLEDRVNEFILAMT